MYQIVRNFYFKSCFISAFVEIEKKREMLHYKEKLFVFMKVEKCCSSVIYSNLIEHFRYLAITARNARIVVTHPEHCAWNSTLQSAVARRCTNVISLSLGCYTETSTCQCVDQCTKCPGSKQFTDAIFSTFAYRNFLPSIRYIREIHP